MTVILHAAGLFDIQQNVIFVLLGLYVVWLWLWIMSNNFEQHSSSRLAPLFQITSCHIPEYTNFCRLLVTNNSCLSPPLPPTH